MRKLFFENGKGEWRKIAEVYSDESAWAAIEEFCSEHNFKIHYTRCHESDGHRHYDVGSHTEFFHLEL